MSRISRRFADLREHGRAGLITFLTAGDPDMATFETVLAGLPASGADLIEVGVPFSDPMADGCGGCGWSDHRRSSARGIR